MVLRWGVAIALLLVLAVAIVVLVEKWYPYYSGVDPARSAIYVEPEVVSGASQEDLSKARSVLERAGIPVRTRRNAAHIPGEFQDLGGRLVGWAIFWEEMLREGDRKSLEEAATRLEEAGIEHVTKGTRLYIRNHNWFRAWEALGEEWKGRSWVAVAERGDAQELEEAGKLEQLLGILRSRGVAAQLLGDAVCVQPNDRGRALVLFQEVGERHVRDWGGVHRYVCPRSEGALEALRSAGMGWIETKDVVHVPIHYWILKGSDKPVVAPGCPAKEDWASAGAALWIRQGDLFRADRTAILKKLRSLSLMRGECYGTYPALGTGKPPEVVRVY